MKIGIVFFISIICFSTCTTNKKNNTFKNTTVPVSFFNNAYYNDTSVWSKAQLIRLETKEGFLLGDIVKIVIENDLIYIQTKDSFGGLYVFNLTGKAMFKVGGYGKGPGEFLVANDFFIKDEMIFIVDAKLRRTNIYKSFTGEFIKSRKENFLIREMEVDKNYSYLININIGKQDTSLCKVINSNKNVINGFLNANNGIFIKGRQLYCFNNNIYLVDEVYNKIYKINEGQINNSYEFNFGKYNLNKEKYEYLSKNNLRLKGIAHEISELCVNKHMLIANIVVKGMFHRLYYDLKTNKACCYNLLKMKSIEAGIKYHYANDTAFFGVINSEILIRYKDNLIYNRNLLNIVIPNDINVSDNPFLIVKKHINEN